MKILLYGWLGLNNLLFSLYDARFGWEQVMEKQDALNLFELNNKELIRALTARDNASELVFSIFLLFLEEKGVIKKNEFFEFIKLKSEEICQSTLKDNSALAETLEEAVQNLLGNIK